MKLEDNSQRNACLPLLHFTKFMRGVRDSMEEKDETVRPDWMQKSPNMLQSLSDVSLS